MPARSAYLLYEVPPSFVFAMSAWHLYGASTISMCLGKSLNSNVAFSPFDVSATSVYHQYSVSTIT